MENEKATIGTGFHDIGPKDVGQEIFAKMEEAAQHAMTIVEGAQKFTDEAAKEQSIKGDANGVNDLIVLHDSLSDKTASASSTFNILAGLPGTAESQSGSCSRGGLQ